MALQNPARPFRLCTFPPPLNVRADSLLCVSDRQLQEEVDNMSERLEEANNALKGDWSRWQSSLRTDLRSALLTASEKSIQHHEKVSTGFLKQVKEQSKSL